MLDYLDNIEYSVDNVIASILFVCISLFAIAIGRGIFNGLLCGLIGAGLSILIGGVVPYFLFTWSSREGDINQLISGFFYKFVSGAVFCFFIFGNQSVIPWANHNDKKSIDISITKENLKHQGFIQLLTETNGSLWIGNKAKNKTILTDTKEVANINDFVWLSDDTVTLSSAFVKQTNCKGVKVNSGNLYILDKDKKLISNVEINSITMSNLVNKWMVNSLCNTTSNSPVKK